MNNEQPSGKIGLSPAQMVLLCKGVIFDLDGTLTDSLWVWDQVDRDFFEKNGINPTAELLEKLDTVDFTKRANLLKEMYNLPQSIRQIKTEWYQNAESYYSKKLKLKPGAKEFIDWLVDHNIPISLATSNTFDLSTSFLENNDVLGKFTSIKTASMVSKNKPAPDIYLSAAEALSVNPKDCIIFEDSDIGVQGACNANIPYVHVRDNYYKQKWEELGKKAVFSIDNYLSLVEELKAIESDPQLGKVIVPVTEITSEEK